MNEIKDGGPAFPITYEIENGLPEDAEPGVYYPVTKGTVVATGMTLRDYFAAKAMAAWLSTYGDTPQHPAGNDAEPQWAVNLAESSYRMADAMLRARGQS